MTKMAMPDENFIQFFDETTSEEELLVGDLMYRLRQEQRVKTFINQDTDEIVVMTRMIGERFVCKIRARIGPDGNVEERHSSNLDTEQDLAAFDQDWRTNWKGQSINAVNDSVV